MFASNTLRSMSQLKTAGIAALFLLTSCGGEQIAGIQGSGATTPADASGTAVGPITAFGSIFVNGVEYSTSGAAIHIDGQSGTEAQLQVGQIVTVKGQVSDDGTTGSATEVSFTADARGAIAQLDTGGGTFIVLGQTVQVTDTTVFGDGIQPAAIEGLHSGDSVEVSAFTDASGNLVASRIELKSSAESLQVKGAIAGLDTNTQTFRINDLTVSYNGIAPDGVLANGAVVSVEGSATSANGSLQASSVGVVPSAAGATNERGDVQGLITSFTSQTDFTVDGQRVATDANTQLILHDQTLGVNLLVKVKGTFNATGVLVASKVEAKPQGSGNGGNNAEGNTGGNGNGNSNGDGNANARDGNVNQNAASADIVRGLVDSVSGNALKVLGVNVTATADTTFNDKSQQHLRTFGMKDMRAGDYVEVRGAADASNEIHASVIERDKEENRSYLQGEVAGVATPEFSVLGIRVTTDSQTHFIGLQNDPKGTDEFFAEVARHVVKVRGTFSAGVLLADQVQIKE